MVQEVPAGGARGASPWCKSQKEKKMHKCMCAKKWSPTLPQLRKVAATTLNPELQSAQTPPPFRFAFLVFVAPM